MPKTKKKRRRSAPKKKKSLNKHAKAQHKKKQQKKQQRKEGKKQKKEDKGKKKKEPDGEGDSQDNQDKKDESKSKSKFKLGLGSGSGSDSPDLSGAASESTKESASLVNDLSLLAGTATASGARTAEGMDDILSMDGGIVSKIETKIEQKLIGADPPPAEELTMEGDEAHSQEVERLSKKRRLLDAIFPLGCINTAELVPLDEAVLQDDTVVMEDKMTQFGFTERAAKLIADDLNRFMPMRKKKVALLELNMLLMENSGSGSELKMRRRRLNSWLVRWLRTKTLSPIRGNNLVDDAVMTSKLKLIHQCKTEATYQQPVGCEWLKEKNMTGVWKEMALLMVFYKMSAMKRIDKKCLNPLKMAGGTELLSHCIRIWKMLDMKFAYIGMMGFFDLLEVFMFRWCCLAMNHKKYTPKTVDIEEPYSSIKCMLKSMGKRDSVKHWKRFAFEAVTLAINPGENSDAKLIEAIYSFGNSLTAGSKDTDEEGETAVVTQDFVEKAFDEIAVLIIKVEEKKSHRKAEKIKAILFRIKTAIYARGQIKTDIYSTFLEMEDWIICLLKFILKRTGNIGDLMSRARSIKTLPQSIRLQKAWGVFSSAMIESLRSTTFRWNSESFMNLGRALDCSTDLPVRNPFISSAITEEPVGSQLESMTPSQLQQQHVGGIFDIFTGASISTSTSNVDQFPFPHHSIEMAIGFLHQ
jgi:hypothetical protein